MAIGLTSEQLALIFLKAFIKRQAQMNVEKMTADIGMNPEMNKLISEIQTKYSDSFNIDQINVFISLVLAFMDSIVSNNNELTNILLKSQP
jgi:hypothetical protein